MNGTIYFRADHELIGRVLAEKLRRKTERLDDLGSFRVGSASRAMAQTCRAA